MPFPEGPGSPTCHFRNRGQLGHHGGMRHVSSATSVSWIPSEAIKGMTRLPFDLSVSHYDDAPPATLGPEDLEAMRLSDRFRFANRLTGWIEVEGDRISGWGQDGGGMIGSTTLQLGRREATFAAVPLPDLHPEPEVGDTWVRFGQTAGGRTGVPAPRRVSRPPFVQVSAPLAWTTLSLTLHVDGRSEARLNGASPFPRHWLYGHDGELLAKSGLIDFRTWYRTAFGKHSPWGDEDTAALVTAVGSALERTLSVEVMRGDQKPAIDKVKAGRALVEQGDEGTDLFLLLDGVLTSEVDGQVLAEFGPGAVLGERSLLEGGRRTATLRTLTPCTVARVSADQVDRAALAKLAEGHRHEDRTS